MRQLLAVGALEAQRVLVAVGGGVQPAGRVEAVVGEGLVGRGAQQLQEGQLDHVDGNVVRPGVSNLGGEHQNHTCVKYTDREPCTCNTVIKEECKTALPLNDTKWATF